MPPLGSEPAEDTLHADLEAAFDGVASGGDTLPEADASSTGDKIPPAEPAAKSGGSVETITAKEPAAGDDRPRGADGKFLPKDAASVSSPSVAAKGATVSPAAPLKSPPADTTKASTEQPSTAADAPPVTWAADAKGEWATLSPAIKAAVLKREVEMSSGGRQWSEEKRHYEAIVAPVRQAASRRGISEAEGIQRLMAAQDRLDRDPVAAIQWLAQAYGVPLTVNGTPSNGQPTADVSSRIESPPPRAQADPRIDAIWSHMQAQEQRETEMTVQKVTSFAADPAHPYFDALNSEIMALLPVLKSSNPTATPDQLLQDAYDRAVWANPETRAALQAERNASEAVTRRASTAETVAKAKLAASSLRPGAPAGLPLTAPRDSIREEIEAAWAGAR